MYVAVVKRKPAFLHTFPQIEEKKPQPGGETDDVVEKHKPKNSRLGKIFDKKRLHCHILKIIESSGLHVELM